MDYTIRQATSEADELPTFLLQDHEATTLLIADHAQGPPPDSRRQVRMVRPSGRLVATIDLPNLAATPGEQDRRVDYAIIHEYAVYAIISVRRRPAEEGDSGSQDYYLLEVEGETWLVLPHPERRECYAIYDEIPPGLHLYDALTRLDLPPAIGEACQHEEESSLHVALAPRRLAHTDLVVLALAYLIERSPFSTAV